MAPHDKDLERHIREYLAAHPSIDISGIEFFVKDGYVSSNGEVDSSDAKMTIEAMVANVPGVIDVANYLHLSRPFESGSGNGLHAM